MAPKTKKQQLQQMANGELPGRGLPEVMKAATARNAAGLGWTAADFGITKYDTNVKGSAPAGGNTLYFQNPQTAGKAAATTMGATPQNGTWGQLPQNLLPLSTPANQVLTPDQQKQVQQYMKNPQEAAVATGPIEGAKTFLSNLFNYEDSYGPNAAGPDNPVEAVWDGFLGGLGWMYNTINQTGSWAVSAMPGGLDTFSWNQAGDISWGQSSAANQAALNEQLGTGVGQLVGTLINPVGAVEGGIGELTRAKFTEDKFDVLDKAQRRAAFEEDTAGKWITGIADTAYTLLADPLIVAGKFAKIARIKYVDRAFNTPQAREALKSELAAGAPTVRTADTKVAPVASFVENATAMDEAGKKILTRDEIFYHPLIKQSPQREQITAALYHARDYETGALVMRYAFGDDAARAELFAKRADLVDAFSRAEWERINQIYHLNPDRRMRVESIAQKSADKANDRVLALEKAGKRGTEEWSLAVRARTNANDSFARTVRGKFDPIDQVTPESIALSKRVYNDILSSDRQLAKAIGDETQRVDGIFNTMKGSTKGFARNNAYGRFVEQHRQSTARKKYETQSVRGRFYETNKTIIRKDEHGNVVSEAKEMRKATPLTRQYWQRDEFGNNGFTRTVRLWRWMSEENPSGFIIVKGMGAHESSREVVAAMDDVPIYSGEARTILVPQEVKDKATGKMKTVMVEHEVGGLKRKQELVGMYMDALNDATAGSNAAALALERVESAMAADIMAWHGVSKNAAQQVMDHARSMRAKHMDSLSDPERRFWIDDDGSMNKMPWLDSQIENGTYMLNYRALEKAARRYDETGLSKFADEFGTFTGENFNKFYSVFNDFWRPAVLMRLGYTQRNVLEGWFRAAAMQSSLKPVLYGVANGSYSFKNAIVNTGARRAEKAARLAAAGQGPVPKRFVTWLDKQIVAREEDIMDTFAYMDDNAVKLAAMDPEYRNYALDYFRKRQNYALDRKVAAQNAGADAGELAAWQAMIDEGAEQVKALSKVKTFAGKSEDSEIAFDILKFHDQALDDGFARRLQLDDQQQSLALFQQQGRSRQRIFSNSSMGPDGLVMRAAFDKDSDLTPVALSMLSSDTTQKSMLQLRMEGTYRTFRATRKSSYERLTPTDEHYWDGLASMVAQIHNSSLGRRIISGQSDEEIVQFLHTSAEGRRVMDFLSGGKRFDLQDVEEAVATARTRYEQLLPSQEARDFMRTAVINEKWNGKPLESLLGTKNADGSFVHNLSPTLGNVEMDFGVKSAMDMWRSFTNTGMKILGTMPEDTLVRQPFYGTRHAKILKEMVEELKQQAGPITQRDVDFLSKQAHARALKDTKDWLYTIERRTNLGTYGETVLPFISAAQNSVTTVGKIVWNDPSVAAIMAGLWRAPNRAGFEDEDGNIVIPIPHAMIPDGIEEALGLDTMMNWKIDKGQLNVIIPESGFGFIPRPGPLVGVPASEIMKNGWFGASVESPDFLRSLFGGKEQADQVWTVWKNYLFGEGQGVSPQTGSLDLLAPPIAQKVIQFVQGEGNAQFGYWYNLQYRSEMANWMAGYRDDIPSKDEIMSKTRGFYMLRMAANIGAVTPPQYQSMIDPLVEMVRKYDQMYPEDSAQRFNQQFGPFLQMIGDYSNSKNVAGMQPTADSVEAARKYSDVINAVSPGLSRMGDLSALTILTMGKTANGLYDDSAYGWQFANEIPGVNETFRKRQKPEESWTQSQINAGWTTYIMQMDKFDAELKQGGYTSYRQNPELNDRKKAFIAQMAENPLFKDWWQDYKEFGSSRTDSAIQVMQAALANEKFMADNADSPIWLAAQQYLYHRDVVRQALADPAREGKSINNADNEDIRQYWDDARGFLAGNPEWAAFANRFLNGDDNPTQPGVQLLDYVETSGQGEAA